LRDELRRKHAELQDADLVVVDKDYNILNVVQPNQNSACAVDGEDGGMLSDDGLSPKHINASNRMPSKSEPGLREGQREREREMNSGRDTDKERDHERKHNRNRSAWESDVNYRGERPIPQRQSFDQNSAGSAERRPAEHQDDSARNAADAVARSIISERQQQTRHEGKIYHCSVNSCGYWFLFANAPEVSTENIYCGMNLYSVNDVMARAPRQLHEMSDPPSAVREWLRGRRIVFTTKRDKDRYSDNIRCTGIHLAFPDLDDTPEQCVSADQGQMNTSIFPEFTRGEVAGEAAAALDARPLIDPKQLASAPHDSRQRVAPQDPRLARQASGGFVMPAPAGVAPAIAPVLTAGPVLDPSMPYFRSSTDCDRYSEPAEDVLPDTKTAWLLLQGGYLCKMQMEPLQMQREPRDATGRCSISFEKFVWNDGSTVDLTHTACMPVCHSTRAHAHTLLPFSTFCQLFIPAACAQH